MITLFDEVAGTYDSFDSSGITDSTASFKVNGLIGWSVKIPGQVEFCITSNTSTKLFFNNSLSATGSYSIVFLARSYLEQIESDFSDTTKISDDLITKKYNQTNIDISNRIVAYLRPLYGMDNSLYRKNGTLVSTFDPLANILNLEIMQQTFAYYLIYLVFKDLSLAIGSQNDAKSQDNFTLFKESVKDALSLIQIDFNEDGEADNNEKRNSVSYTRLTR